MIDSEFTRLLGSQIVQITLLAIVVWCVVKMVAKNRPHLAHALWLLVLLKCLTPPIWSSPVSPFSWMSANSATSARMEPEQVSESINTTERLPRYPKLSLKMNSLPTSPSLEKPHANLDHNEAEPNMPERLASSPATEHSVSNGGSWVRGFVWVWLMSGGLALLISAARFARFWAWLSRCEVSSRVNLSDAVDRVAAKLGLRRRVNVCVLNASVGPAVIGLLRPTILLPESIVRDKSEVELEPLLAHELNHVRRGDLWWALIQALARNLFWFHPLVWLADKMVTRESERSCDEETIASLGCSPATYARCLIEVLEQKHMLRVSPALPGVRPVEVTSARLERVMKLGQGSYRRTPAAVWLVLVACSIVALPGAALVFAQDEDSQNHTEGLEGAVEKALTDFDANSVSRSYGTVLPRPRTYSDEKQYFPQGPEFKLSREARALKEHSYHDANDAAVDRVISKFDSEQEPWICESFNVKKIMDKIRTENLGTRTAEERLILELPCRYPSGPESGNVSSTPGRRNVEISTRHGIVRLGGQENTIKIVGDRLLVYDTETVVGHVRRMLKQMAATGLNQIVVDCQLAKVPEHSLGELALDWSIGQSGPGKLFEMQNAVTSDQGLEGAFGANVVMLAGEAHEFSKVDNGQSNVKAASFVEKTSPVIFALVGNEEAREFVNTTERIFNSKVTQAPTVTMFSGQDAEIMDGSDRPFVVGLKQVAHPKDASKTVSQPVIRVVSDGTKVKFNATLLEDRSVDLDCLIKLSKILSVEEATVPKMGNAQQTKIQIPEVAVNQIQSSMNIPEGKTLVLGFFADNDEGDREAVLVTLTCRSILTEIPVSFHSVDQVSSKQLGEILGGMSQLPPVVKVLNADGEFEVDPGYVLSRQRELMVPTLPAPSSLNPTQTNANEDEEAKLYRLDEGDVLGVHIEGILGERGVAPPVMLPPQGSELPPSIGSPIPVREGGKVALPLIAPIDVKGMTVEQARQAIKRAYHEGDDAVPDAGRIIVTLYRMRKLPDAKNEGLPSTPDDDVDGNDGAVGSMQRWLIRSGVSANQQTEKEVPTEFLEAFRRLEIDVEIQGQVEYIVAEDYVAISGEELSLTSGFEGLRNGDCLIQGERGELRFHRTGSNLLEVRLEGNARLKASDFSLSADKLVYGTTDQANDAAIQFHLEGKATFDNGDIQIAGETIKIGSQPEPEIIFVEGNAELTRAQPAMNISAQRIKWDLDTDDITSSNE